MSYRFIVIAALTFGCGGATPVSPRDTGTATAASEEHDHGAPTDAFCPQGSTLTYANFGRAFLETNCTGCHASYLVGPARHGAPDDHNFDELWRVREQLGHIDAVAAAGRNDVRTDMPPVPPMPSEDDRRKLGEWIACGAP